MTFKLDINMALVNVRQIPRLEGNRLSTLGGVREHTDTHTHIEG